MGTSKEEPKEGICEAVASVQISPQWVHSQVPDCKKSRIRDRRDGYKLYLPDASVLATFPSHHYDF